MGTFSNNNLETPTDVDIAIVVSRFNEKITSALLDGALNAFDKAGVARDKIDVHYVPGSLELAVVAKAAAVRGADAVVCLGAVIRGDTSHYEYVCNTTALSIADVATSTGVPCIFGVLTVDNESQAQERIGGAHGHKGEEAATTALETIATLRSITRPKATTGFTS
jgi:6,7-dimethyl-8-ribityllumazine synthase